MSTINKVDKQQKLSKGRRLEALAFFLAQAKSPGAVGVIAAQIHADLLAIHRAPELNGPEKDDEFRKYIQRASRGPNATLVAEPADGDAGDLPAVPDVSSHQADGQV